MNVVENNVFNTDLLNLYGTSVSSRLLLGTARYPSPKIMSASVLASGTEVVTVSLRRELARDPSGHTFHDLINELGVRVLPNTAGCRTAKEAVTTALMARELFATNWIKLEVIANDDTLQPDLFGLVEAAKELCSQEFNVFPYTTEDLSAADKLMAAGCKVLMPWGAPIGTGRGLENRYGLVTMRNYFAAIPLIVDAGVGVPSHACEAMEIGFDGVLLNTAVARAVDPVAMAGAFAKAVEAGRAGYLAGQMEQCDMAAPSTPVAGTPFFDLEKR